MATERKPRIIQLPGSAYVLAEREKAISLVQELGQLMEDGLVSRSDVHLANSLWSLCSLYDRELKQRLARMEDRRRQLPKTLKQALRAGYRATWEGYYPCFDGDTKRSGAAILEKDGHPPLVVRFNATYKFGDAWEYKGTENLPGGFRQWKVPTEIPKGGKTTKGPLTAA